MSFPGPVRMPAEWAEQEWLIIAPGCDEATTLKQAERFGAQICGEVMETPEGRISVTASLGVATSHQRKTVSAAAFLRAVSRALDRARKQEGNRVELALSEEFA